MIAQFLESIKEGYSKEEIFNFLKENEPEIYNEIYNKYAESKKYGYSDEEIFDYLEKSEKPKETIPQEEAPQQHSGRKELTKGYSMVDIAPVLKGYIQKEGFNILRRPLAGVADILEWAVDAAHPENAAIRAVTGEERKPFISQYIRPSEENLTPKEKELGRAVEEITTSLIPIGAEEKAASKAGASAEKLAERAVKLEKKAIKPRKTPEPFVGLSAEEYGIPEKGILEEAVDRIFGERKALPKVEERESLYPKKEEVVKKLTPQPTVKEGEVVKEGRKGLSIRPKSPEALPLKKHEYAIPTEGITSEKKGLSIRPQEPQKLPLKPRAYSIKNAEVAEDVISPHETISHAESGTSAINTLKAERKASEEEAKKLYDIAENKYKNLGFDSTTKKEASHIFDSVIKKISKQPTPGEQKVLDEINKFLKNLEKPNFLINDALKVSNSIGNLANYDMVFPNAKNLLKEVVGIINSTAEKSLKRQKKNPIWIKNADKYYGEMADRFYSDELFPFYEKKILNPGGLFTKAANDVGVYNALKATIGNENFQVIDRLDKEFIKNLTKKYEKNPNLVDSRDFGQDIKDLSSIIGSDRGNRVKKFFEEKFKHAKTTEVARGKSAEIERRFKKREGEDRPEIKEVKRILKAERPKKEEIIRKLSAEKRTEVERRFKTREPYERPRIKEPERKLKPIEGEYKTPEDIDAAFNKRSGIRKLHRQMKEAHLEKEFTELSADKMASILSNGTMGSKKLTGQNVYDNLIKEHNYEIASELIGESNVKEILANAKRHANVEITATAAKDIFKNILHMAIGGKALKILFKFI